MILNNKLYFEFLERIDNEFYSFKQTILNKSQEDLFNDSFRITAIREIYRFLAEDFQQEDELAIKLLKCPNGILTTLYEYENRYYEDVMWTSWANLNKVVKDFIREMEEKS